VEDKVLLTLELTQKQNEFISSVGLGVLIQQGAMMFASDAMFEKQEATVEPRDITPPQDASS